MTNVPIDFDLDEIKSKDDYNKDQLKAFIYKASNEIYIR